MSLKKAISLAILFFLLPKKEIASAAASSSKAIVSSVSTSEPLATAQSLDETGAEETYKLVDSEKNEVRFNGTNALRQSGLLRTMMEGDPEERELPVIKSSLSGVSLQYIKAILEMIAEKTALGQIAQDSPEIFANAVQSVGNYLEKEISTFSKLSQKIRYLVNMVNSANYLEIEPLLKASLDKLEALITIKILKEDPEIIDTLKILPPVIQKQIVQKLIRKDHDFYQNHVRSRMPELLPKEIGDPFSDLGVVVFSPDNKYVASLAYSATRAIIWDLERRTKIGEVLTGPYSHSFTWSPDGKFIAFVLGEDKGMRIWNVQDGIQICKDLTGHDRMIEALGWSPDGKYIASASLDNTIRIWDVELCAQAGEPLIGHKGGVSAVSWSPNGKYIASGSEDNTIRIWDVHARAQIGKPLIGHENKIISLSWSPDGKYIVSGSLDNTIRIWDSETRKQIGDSLMVEGPDMELWPYIIIKWSPDGQYIASGSGETIRIWDVQTGTSIGKPLKTDETRGLDAVSWSADGNYLISGSLDNPILKWDIKKYLEEENRLTSLTIEQLEKVITPTKGGSAPL